MCLSDQAQKLRRPRLVVSGAIRRRSPRLGISRINTDGLSTSMSMIRQFRAVCVGLRSVFVAAPSLYFNQSLFQKS